jgi:hypothetical protein
MSKINTTPIQGAQDKAAQEIPTKVSQAQKSLKSAYDEYYSKPGNGEAYCIAEGFGIGSNFPEPQSIIDSYGVGKEFFPPPQWTLKDPVPTEVNPPMVDSLKTLNSIIDELNGKISHLDDRVACFDANIINSMNKAVESIKDTQSQVAAHTKPMSPPKVEFVLTQEDLKELERMLDTLEPVAIKQVGLKTPQPVMDYATSIAGESTAAARSDHVHAAVRSDHVHYSEPNIQTNSDYFGRDREMAIKKNGWLHEPDGTQKHYVDGKLHNDLGPAEIRPNGTELFYRNGKLHRDGNLPAMIGRGGTKKYAVNGKYHRVGGQPAIVWSKSPYAQEWWLNGEIKSVLKRDGTQEWYAPGATEREEGRLHREDGPAVVHPNGRQEFWLDGVQYRNQVAWEDALLHRNNSQEQILDRELIDEDPIDAYETTETTQVSRKKEKKKMNKPSFTEMLKQNAADAGYRVAATQSTNIVKNAVLTVMRNKGADDGAVAGFAKFLDTEFGAALISFALGAGLNYVPHLSDDPRVARLAEEMRINGMATAGNAVIGEAMAHVLPALTQVLQNLPAVEENASNVRVIEAESRSDNRLAETLEEEESEATATPKTMKA